MKRGRREGEGEQIRGNIHFFSAFNGMSGSYSMRCQVLSSRVLMLKMSSFPEKRFQTALRKSICFTAGIMVSSD